MHSWRAYSELEHLHAATIRVHMNFPMEGEATDHVSEEDNEEDEEEDIFF